MPKAWSSKRERQYEHVKDSEKKQGRSTKRAKEIAARTVNKQRAQKGETKGSSSRSSSSSRSTSSRSSSSRSGASSRSGSSSRSSSSRRRTSSNNSGPTKEQLYKQAKRLGIEGRSKMNKQQLQRAVARRK
jgi:Rho termination factor, N-terminal domain